MKKKLAAEPASAETVTNRHTGVRLSKKEQGMTTRALTGGAHGGAGVEEEAGGRTSERGDGPLRFSTRGPKLSRALLLMARCRKLACRATGVMKRHHSPARIS